MFASLSRKRLWALALIMTLMVAGALLGCAPEADPDEPVDEPEEPEDPEEEDPDEDEPEEEPEPEDPKEGGSMVMAIAGEEVAPPDAHDAATISDLSGAAMFSEPLVIWKDGEFIGVLAEDWDVSEDGLTYTFHLRDGVQYQNGEQFTAEDVKKNYERIVDPDDPKYSAGVLAIVDEVEVVDDLVVAMHLEYMDPDFLTRLIRVWMLEPGSWADDEYPVGTGPFEITGYAEDEYLTVERFDGYWGDTPYLDDITMRAVPDPDTQVLELETGGADIIVFAPPAEGDRLEGEGFNVMPFGRVNWGRITINLQTVTELAVRKAINYAVDRQALIDVAYSGYGEPMNTLVVPDSWADRDDLSGYEYDPARAEEILDEAGFVDTTDDGIREINGDPIQLHLPTRGDDEAWLRTTQMVQQMLFDVGIGSEITTGARLSYYDEVRTGQYDITWFISNADPEPPIASGNLDSSSYWNVSQMDEDDPVQQKMDELIDASMTTLDEDERAEYFYQLNELWYEEAIEGPGMWMLQIHIAQPDVGGVYLAPTGIFHQAENWYIE